MFIDEEHQKFYAKYEAIYSQDPEKKALFYCLGLTSQTRRNVENIYDFEHEQIFPECISDGWQTGGTLKVVKMGFSLYNNFPVTPLDAFQYEEFESFFYNAIKIRFNQYIY